MHIQGSQWPATVAVAHAHDGAGSSHENSRPHSNGTAVTNGAGTGTGGRSTPLRVDAQRNLEHVLRAAREVFGELGYGAPMEDVARRARVGVGTVYRRFPSKDVLVRRIAEEETSRLTDQARTALGQEDDPWSALSRFLRTSVASGAGRLLPPGILRVSADAERSAGPTPDGAEGPRVPDGLSEARVPQQRTAPGADGAATDFRPAERRDTQEGEPAASEEATGAEALLDVVGRLVERAKTAGELRADVTVSDILLVIATGAPTLPDPGQQQAASARLLEILLEGLRSRPAR
ncbi:TetR/AcrR family transcriptional regulator [Streptomyces sp. Je 1-4]|uniref:TetR/AcrR family transcriptional regulator n=1 Tax=Streptomyces TaxID=1883 RepID=UPI00140F03C9|nr:MULTISPECIES: TetR/AcrR family transcriptional regulator [unclassified Streptomyces]QIK07976.1 TetR/AcrR family transcriptional regulator [Streptomyces sp. ID38640]UYB41580.1 TetR/AcrR family transcriptional regulator [Streptomyces sp. Je 1-4]UZQ37825.1 TetR/AcrR family transcriptional regulator [Streptomyces sp. Je 1-4] [Streptomyces sp. Je 1-4 4N24]UZQ45242.1 TetR/AcrR family transcriptional regulator [Streptomyces sp. Je 1-4] [Streptomyces sp. Je 1-4 4N24_ara]